MNYTNPFTDIKTLQAQIANLENQKARLDIELETAKTELEEAKKHKKTFLEMEKPEQNCILLIPQTLSIPPTSSLTHCMHIEVDGCDVSICDDSSTYTCEACGRPLCTDHKPRYTFFDGIRNRDCCESCADLDDADLAAIRSLRLELNRP